MDLWILYENKDKLVIEQRGYENQKVQRWAIVGITKVDLQYLNA